MTVLKVLEFPDKRLRIKASPVAVIDDAVRKIVEDMIETMYAEDGAGLAGTQVDIHQQIVVMDDSHNQSNPMCIINPEIISCEGTQYEYEGCLSFPNAYDKVERALKLRVKAYNQFGEAIEFDAEGFLAKCIQHELDHLNGILFIDHLSKLRQDRVRKVLNTNKRRTA